jgi:hypothetical protein
MNPQGNGEAKTSRDVGNLGVVFLLSPHLPTACDEKPEFLDGSMSDRFRDLAWPEFEVSHPTARKLQQNADVGSIGRNSIARDA